MVNDPLGDFINRLKNANAVKSEVAVSPYSKLKESVANLLKKEGYVGFINNKGKGAKKVLEVGLLYKKDGSPRISQTKRVSKPGRRVYQGFKEMRPVKFGHGMLVLSTPQGIVSDKDAKKDKIGGEALFKIW
jgi:small subunit ribosomal protein S8